VAFPPPPAPFFSSPFLFFFSLFPLFFFFCLFFFFFSPFFSPQKTGAPTGNEFPPKNFSRGADQFPGRPPLGPGIPGKPPPKICGGVWVLSCLSGMRSPSFVTGAKKFSVCWWRAGTAPPWGRLIRRPMNRQSPETNLKAQSNPSIESQYPLPLNKKRGGQNILGANRCGETKGIKYCAPRPRFFVVDRPFSGGYEILLQKTVPKFGTGFFFPVFVFPRETGTG